MVEVVLPDKLEGTMSANGGNFPLYTPSSLSITASFSLSSTSVTFYNISGKTYRRVVKPGTGLQFKAAICNAFNYTDNSTVNAGSYKKFTLGNKVEGTVRVGDFAYGKDGGTLAFYPGSTTTDAPDKENCIGVVATVGQFGTHGTVIAKNTTSAKTVFGVTLTEPTVMDRRGSAVSNYSPKAPSGCSWYLPKTNELRYFRSGSTSGSGITMKNMLNPYLLKAGGKAWEDEYYYSSEGNILGIPKSRPQVVFFKDGSTRELDGTYPIRISFDF